jgi:DNA-binding FadR family transcriptional regulator
MRLESQNPFQPVQKTRVSRAVEAQIRELIAGGQAKSGDRLPSERVMAHALGVGRSPLREAIRVLQFSGLLYVRPRAGIFLAAPAALRSPGSDSTAAGNTEKAASEFAADHRTPLQ